MGIEEMRQLLLEARAEGNLDEARRIQNMMCETIRRCELCRACKGWAKGNQGTSGMRRKYEV